MVDELSCLLGPTQGGRPEAGWPCDLLLLAGFLINFGRVGNDFVGACKLEQARFHDHNGFAFVIHEIDAALPTTLVHARVVGIAADGRFSLSDALNSVEAGALGAVADLGLFAVVGRAATGSDETLPLPQPSSRKRHITVVFSNAECFSFSVSSLALVGFLRSPLLIGVRR